MASVIHVRQGKKQIMCGQCCVAMATGQPVEEVCEQVGHEEGTLGTELVRALAAFGVRALPERRLTASKPLPQRAILRLMNMTSRGTWDRRWGGHWVLLWDGIIYDPDARKPMGVAWYQAKHMDRKRDGLGTLPYFDSAIELTDREESVEALPPRKRAAGRKTS